MVLFVFSETHRIHMRPTEISHAEQPEFIFNSGKTRLCLYEKQIELHLFPFISILLTKIHLKILMSSLPKTVDIGVIKLIINLHDNVLNHQQIR